MLTVTICRGLSGSGKTTWAKEQVDKSDGSTIIVCKDDIRGMAWNSKYSSGREAFVKKVRNNLIILGLSEGKHVISADTNYEKNESEIREIVQLFCEQNNTQVEIKIQDFSHVPLQVCIDRDSQRPKPLGEKVIRSQYNRWIKKETNALVQDKNLPKAVIFDLDGTLAHMFDRKPFEWSRVGEDLIDEELAQMAKDLYLLDNKILVVSGRDAVCRQETVDWLNKHEIPFDDLFMRPEEDSRKDSIVKREIFFNDIYSNYYVRFVFDDRNQVVETWRDIGLKCYQVAEGDF